MTKHSDSYSASPSPLESAGPALHAILRIGAGLLFMQHGAQKLFGALGADGPVPLFSLMGLAGILEFFGGLLIVLGLLTRPVALLLALQMLAAYFMAHLPKHPWPVLNAGEPALLFMLIFLFLAGNGSGPWSLDHVLKNRSQR